MNRPSPKYGTRGERESGASSGYEPRQSRNYPTYSNHHFSLRRRFVRRRGTSVANLIAHTCKTKTKTKNTDGRHAKQKAPAKNNNDQNKRGPSQNRDNRTTRNGVTKGRDGGRPRDDDALFDSRQNPRRAAKSAPFSERIRVPRAAQQWKNVTERLTIFFLFTRSIFSRQRELWTSQNHFPLRLRFGAPAFPSTSQSPKQASKQRGFTFPRRLLPVRRFSTPRDLTDIAAGNTPHRRSCTTCAHEHTHTPYSFLMTAARRSYCLTREPAYSAASRL